MRKTAYMYMYIVYVHVRSELYCLALKTYMYIYTCTCACNVMSCTSVSVVLQPMWGSWQLQSKMMTVPSLPFKKMSITNWVYVPFYACMSLALMDNNPHCVLSLNISLSVRVRVHVHCTCIQVHVHIIHVHVHTCKCVWVQWCCCAQEIEAFEAAIDGLREKRLSLKKKLDDQVSHQGFIHARGRKLTVLRSTAK